MASKRSTERTVLAVCDGSDCARDRHDDHRELCVALRSADAVEIVETRCLGLCHGPVAVIDPGGPAPVVVERIRSPRHRAELVAAASGERMGRKLSKRVVRGKKAAKAVRRALRPRS